MIYIIWGHTNIENKFVILKFSLKVGKRAVPLWYKVFLYKEDENKDFKHVKKGLKFLHKIITPYKYKVTIFADRGFKSVDLFEDQEIAVLSLHLLQNFPIYINTLMIQQTLCEKK